MSTEAAAERIDYILRARYLKGSFSVLYAGSEGVLGMLAQPRAQHGWLVMKSYYTCSTNGGGDINRCDSRDPSLLAKSPSNISFVNPMKCCNRGCLSYF